MRLIWARAARACDPPVKVSHDLSGGEAEGQDSAPFTPGLQSPVCPQQDTRGEDCVQTEGHMGSPVWCLLVLPMSQPRRKEISPFI